MMKRLIAACLLLMSGEAGAQTYIDETSNYGIMTHFLGVSPYNVVDEFTLPATTTDAQGNLYALAGTTISVHGQDGPGVCSGRGCGGRVPTYKTTIAPPDLEVAQANPGGDQPDLYAAAAPPFSYTPTVIRGVSYDGWTLTTVLPPGTYNLHLAGTSCGGYLCQLAGDSYLYVTVKMTWTLIQAAPPPKDD